MKHNTTVSTRNRPALAAVMLPATAIAGVLACAGALCAAAPATRGAPASPAKVAGPFQPSWESLQQYRCPDWFRDAKFGIAAHWGPQSVPEQGDGYSGDIYEDDEEAYKYHVQHYGHPSQVGYKEITRLWCAEHWEPEKLIQLYKRAGARYFVAMANDRDNFDCFDSKYQPWNSVNIGPHKDIVGTWARVARQSGLRFGVSVSAAQAWTWFLRAAKSDDDGTLIGVPYDGRLTRADGKGKWWEGYDPQDLYAQNHRPGAKPDQPYVDKYYRRTRDLIDQYRPEMLSFDDRVMPLERVSDVGLRLAADFYNANSQQHRGRLQAVLNTRNLNEEQRRCLVWGIERGIPDRIEPYPWQIDTSIGQWTYRRSAFEKHRYKTPATVIHMLADTVSKNGNLLLNIPLRGDGTLDADEVAFLDEMARWMQVNQEAIYGTRPWKVYGEGPTSEAPALPYTNLNETVRRRLTAQDIRFTTRQKILYAIACGWPESGTLTIRSLAAGSPLATGKVTDVHLLGHEGSLRWTQTETGLAIQLPAQKPCDHAVAFKIAGVGN
jgi:alpha-L-fucosidase